MTLPPATVIGLWNRVAEDSGTLADTILKFADLLVAAAQKAPRDVSSDSGCARKEPGKLPTLRAKPKPSPGRRAIAALVVKNFEALKGL